MKFRQELLGIVLAFAAAGFIATNADAKAYQEVYQQRDPQVVKIKKALSSEFISAADKKQLQQDVKNNNEAEQTETRRSLRTRSEKERKLLSEVQTRMTAAEEKAAKSELAELSADVESLEKKSQEKFILAADAQQTRIIRSSLTKLNSSDKVRPIRDLASQTKHLSSEMKDNQSKMKDLAAALKESNQASADLSKKNYLLESDKEELAKNQKENTKFLDDADDLEKALARKNESEALVYRLQKKQEKTEKDFKENESQANDLLKSSNDLLAAGSLTAAEKEALTGAQQALSSSLSMKNYKPGDLASNYQALHTKYDESLNISNQRIEEAKKKAEQEAAEKAAREKEEAEKQQAAAASSSSAPAPSLAADGWYQAPAGYKFLKVDSGLTYGQVKNPGNFSLITDAQAAESGHRPGHGNGSAKQ